MIPVIRPEYTSMQQQAAPTTGPGIVSREAYGPVTEAQPGVQLILEGLPKD